MIKLEISLTGAGLDELRQLEALMQQILSSMKPHLKGIETTLAAVPVADPYESTKKKILDHICWRKIETGDCLNKDFWEVDIQDWLNPKDKKNLYSAIDSLCDDGYLEPGADRRTYYLTHFGYNAIY
ncbi:hypothetical protein [Burkholderia multivorans]|uniref:hypothetical protein n=1 Tax=Burkholderia multivorans TaxID=87883 RepID=UPI000752DE3E|nr:hypothetical protein [Burkholderia multivorans]KWH26325.1 hypothetical protein WL98_06400 [Burkholderia multivorans]